MIHIEYEGNNQQVDIKINNNIISFLTNVGLNYYRDSDLVDPNIRIIIELSQSQIQFLKDKLNDL